MKYIKGSPYFCKTAKNLRQYTYQDKDIFTDVLIVGGGICGAILNFYLSQKYDVTLIDKGRFGQNCTSIATAILEYQLDEFYQDLESEITEQEIIEIYKMGQNSIKKIENFIKKYKNECNFAKRPSFLFSQSGCDVTKMKSEFMLRKKYKFDCQYFDRTNNPFPFSISCGIYDKNGGAELNPYLFCKQLIENANNQDKIFENTSFESFTQKNEKFIVNTCYNHKIYANKIIFCTGFDLELFQEELMQRFVTYSIVTNPQKNITWKNCATVHDSEQPYHYLRKLPDDRIIFGGEDVSFKKTNFSKEKCEKKYKKLLQSLKFLFPKNDNIQIDYKFCGAFGTTKNNLGLIGETDTNNIYLFLSCGANGIVNAMEGVNIVEYLFNHKTHPLAHLFSLMRVFDNWQYLFVFFIKWCMSKS